MRSIRIFALVLPAIPLLPASSALARAQGTTGREEAEQAEAAFQAAADDYNAAADGRASAEKVADAVENTAEIILEAIADVVSSKVGATEISGSTNTDNEGSEDPPAC